MPEQRAEHAHRDGEGSLADGRAPTVWRSYQVLWLRHVEGLEIRAIQTHLAISGSTYYRAYRRGLQAVVSLLQLHWQTGL